MNHLLFPKKQRGATLLISLILLLMLTVLALAAGRTASLQQRMASNLQQQNVAFQTAESGIQAAVIQLTDEKNRPQQGTPKYLFSANDIDMAKWSTTDCSSRKENYYYCVKVEQVDCTSTSAGSGGGNGATSTGEGGTGINLIGLGTCFTITSTGRFNSALAVHQQGYIF